MAEDYLRSLYIITYGKKIVYFYLPLYCYRYNFTSISRNYSYSSIGKQNKKHVYRIASFDYAYNCVAAMEYLFQQSKLIISIPPPFGIQTWKSERRNFIARTSSCNRLGVCHISSATRNTFTRILRKLRFTLLDYKSLCFRHKNR